MHTSPRRPANFGRYAFLDPRARVFYRDWNTDADQTVALPRAEVGRSPHDDILSLIDSDRSRMQRR
jgi:hypothetical protein